jgi:endogenous inhibitor of DNA gyrase (YacG/DUF329 family)
MPDPFGRPLDAVLMGLRLLGIDYHQDVERHDRWWAACPACQGGVVRVTELEHDHVEAYCDRRCQERDVIATLGEAVRLFLLEQREDQSRAA